MNAQSRNSSEGGYTLIQLAVSLMILGIMLAGAAQAYLVYMRSKEIRTTDGNIQYVIDELQRYKQLTGHFPCPAPLTAPRTDPTYGSSTDCENVTVAIGSAPAAGATGENGVAIAQSFRTDITNRRVRIGAVPFRTMNLDENATYDGYGSRLVYALTESMADRETYDTLAGGIGIVDASGNNLLFPIDSALYTIFSPGKDRLGGYDKEGNPFGACPGTTLDSQNCDFGTDARFASSLERSASGSTHYDDRISYFAAQQDTMWSRTEANEDDIGDLTKDGNIGMGTQHPVTKLDVQDSSVSGDGPEGSLRSSTSLQTNTLCPNTPGSSNNCFEPRNIAGNNSINPANNTPGDGMKCPPGTYMNGIQDGRAICGPAAVHCNSSSNIMTGIDADGNPVCSVMPCGSQTQNICGTPQTLPASAIGTYITLTGGSTGTYSETWRCRNQSGVPTWRRQSTTGSCTCTPGVETEGGIDCGYGFDGTFTRTVTTTCPDGNETVTDDFAAQCTCAAVPPYTETYDCPNDNFSGSITYTWNWICPDAYWSDPDVTDTCVCSPPPETHREEVRNDECDDGYTGTVTYVYDFNSAPGVCDWEQTNITNACTCNTAETRTTQEDPTCQPWEYVREQATYTQVRDGDNCTWGSRTLTTPGLCSPRSFRWQIFSSPGGAPQSNQVGPMVGSSDGCDYNAYTAETKVNCSSPSGAQYQVHKCRCVPLN